MNQQYEEQLIRVVECRARIELLERLARDVAWHVREGLDLRAFGDYLMVRYIQPTLIESRGLSRSPQ